jgi:hypothetical protein
MILISILLAAFLTIGLVGCETPLLVKIEPSVDETATVEPVNDLTEVNRSRQKNDPTTEDTSEKPSRPTLLRPRSRKQLTRMSKCSSRAAHFGWAAMRKTTLASAAGHQNSLVMR